MKNLQKKKAQSRVVRIVVALLTVLCMNMNMMNVLAAESTQPALVENTTVERSQAVDAVVPETASQTNADDGIMPLAASGYAAGYTDYTSGSFTISVSGSSLFNSVRFKAWSFSDTAKVYVTLYRPDNSVAVSEFNLPLEQLTSKTVSNVSSGNWRLSYFIIGNGRGWINCEFR